jgi:hypothetical protein
MEEVRYQTQVNKILLGQFYTARRVENLNSGAADVPNSSHSQNNLMAT